MHFQAELKKTLLLRYNLLDFDCTAQNKQAETAAKKKIIQIASENITAKNYKRICKRKTKNVSLFKGEIEMLKTKCIRKITSLLKN